MSDHRSTYRSTLAVPGVPGLLAFAVLARLPNATASIVITLFVVLGSGRGYAAAGLVGAAWTLGIAIGSPWRGRRLDRIGVRRTVLPSVVVEGAAWLAVPFVGYRLLLVVALAGGLMQVPVFTVIRQALTALVPPVAHHQVYALDAIATEITYMIGPAVGVVLATVWSPTGAVLSVGAVTVSVGLALVVLDPPIVSERVATGATGTGPTGSAPLGGRLRRIFVPGMLGVMAATTATVAVLAGTEVSIVALLRELGASGSSWIVFLVWSVMSVTGGLILGALRRPLPLPVLLLGLGLLTVPVGLAPQLWWLVALMLPAGFFCAPTLTASAAAVGRLVPETLRGEAMGWYGTATTGGMALGAPLAGAAIDRAGAWAGFALLGAVGVVVAMVGLLVVLKHDRPGPAGPGAQSGVSPTRRRAAESV